MRLAITAIWLVASTVLAAAHDDPRVTTAEYCATVDDALVRLYCFDRVFPPGDGLPPADSAPLDEGTDTLEPG